MSVSYGSGQVIVKRCQPWQKVHRGRWQQWRRRRQWWNVQRPSLVVVEGERGKGVGDEGRCKGCQLGKTNQSPFRLLPSLTLSSLCFLPLPTMTFSPSAIADTILPLIVLRHNQQLSSFSVIAIGLHLLFHHLYLLLTTSPTSLRPLFFFFFTYIYVGFTNIIIK